MEEHAPVGNAVIDEVVGEGELVGIGAAAQQPEQHADLGGEAQARPVEEGEERAPAERILRQQAALAVPDDEREGPVDALEQPLAPARVPGRHRLGHRGVRAQAELLAQGVGPVHAPRHARQHALRAGGLGAGHGQGARLDDGGARQRASQPVAFAARPAGVVDAGELPLEMLRHHGARSPSATSAWRSTASATFAEVAPAPARTW